MDYEALLLDLECPSFVVDTYRGRVHIPEEFFDAPPRPGYGAPPIMIPLLSTGGWPGYIGMNTSWFGGEDHGFVKFYAETGRMVEVALTVAQLKAFLIREFHLNLDDLDNVREFAEAIGFCSNEEVDRTFGEFSSYKDLLTLDAFRENIPRWLSNDENDAQPVWVAAKTREEVERLIECGDYLTAWHAINSPGILYRDDMAFLLQKIAPYAGDSRFDKLVECWLAANPA